MERGKETRERGSNKEESGPEVNGGTWRRNRSKGAGSRRGGKRMGVQEQPVLFCV